MKYTPEDLRRIRTARKKRRSPVQSISSILKAKKDYCLNFKKACCNRKKGTCKLTDENCTTNGIVRCDLVKE